MARIAGYFSLYFFFLSLIVGFLYIIGNLQGFLDETLLLLISILEWVLFVFCIADIYYGVFSTVRIARGGRKYSAPVASLFGVLYGIGLLILINFLYSWFLW